MNQIKSKLIVLLALSALFVPLSASALVSVPFVATSTTQGWIFPNRVNGSEQSILGQNFIGTSTSLSNIFPKLFFTNATGSTLALTSIANSSLLKIAPGSGGGIIAAVSGTDYLASIGSGTNGQLTYWGGTNTLVGVATTSATCAGILSCTGFTVVGASPITLTGTMSFAWPWTKQAGGEQSTSTIMGLYNGFLSLASSTVNSSFLVAGSTTLQNFTASNATTSILANTGNYLTLGTAATPAYVGSTTSRMMPFASTSPLDASGFSISIGTTTYQLGSFPTAVKLVSIVGQASTTAAASGGMLCKIGTLPSTFSETVLFNQNYKEYSISTNANIAAHTPIVLEVSSASSTPQTGYCQGNFVRTSGGTN